MQQNCEDMIIEYEKDYLEELYDEGKCKNKKYKYVLRLDIDNFFDTIDHFLLRRRLIAAGIPL